MQELESIGRRLADAMDSASAQGVIGLASDDELLGALQALGGIQRRLDGAITAATDRVIERDRCECAARLSTQNGCRDAADLLRRALRVDGQTARRYVSAAEGVHRDLDITSGGLLPAPFPELAVALQCGELSLTGFLACTTPLQTAVRLSAADRVAADAVLGRFATGRPLDGETDGDDASGPRPTTDELAGLAAHVISRLDPDGDEPVDRAAKRRRHLTIGRLRDGSVPLRGELLPEVAAQLQKLIDSLLNPKVDPDSPVGGRVQFRPSEETDADTETDADGMPDHRIDSPPQTLADLRTHAQKRHDALATILGVAAASGDMPQIGGAAPTLVVSVSAEDFVSGIGRATIEGSGYEVPLGAAAHAACAGGVQRVLFDTNGAIIGIGTSGRIFNAYQRRAIVLRDRTCLVPGCDIRAEWCEIHHVIEHARGGPTHTDNGVPLCWHHHRTLDEGIWAIRMRAGRPEIRGPKWWDPYGLWRAPHLDYRAVDESLITKRAREPATTSW